MESLGILFFRDEQVFSSYFGYTIHTSSSLRRFKFARKHNRSIFRNFHHIAVVYNRLVYYSHKWPVRRRHTVAIWRRSLFLPDEINTVP